MITPGLVSITFRQLKAEEIIDLVAKAGLSSIEWGGDVHVPHGDVAIAREIRKRTEEAGLQVAAYGSYYRTGLSEKDGPAFKDVLASAVELSAPTIRVWAGKIGSADADAATRNHIVDETRRIADAAGEAGISISFEYHRNTLTDTNESAVRLLDEVNHPNVFSLWQPSIGFSVEECIQGLESIKPKLTNLHVYSWSDDGSERLPLEARADRWRQYLRAAWTEKKPRHALIEFVRENKPENFIADAATLKAWIAELAE